MRILIHAPAPWACSGYANQAGQLGVQLRERGHEVLYSAFFGLDGAALSWNDFTVLPRPKTAGSYGHAALGGHAERFHADLVVTLCDVWQLPAQICGRVPWVPWVPIDAEPVAPPIREILSLAMRPVAFSRFGERSLRAAGLDPAYAPLAIDTALFCPGDQAEARQAVGLPADAFVVGMVAANLEQPSRKAFPEQLQAFARLKKKHADAVLYMHSEPGESGGVHLPQLLGSLGLELGRDVFFPDRYRLEVLGFPAEHMVQVFRSMDVLLSVSASEGFCLPLLEAQACGVPVVTGDWLATGELCFGGWKVPADQAQRFWSPLGTWWYVPRVGAIADALANAYKQARGDLVKRRARAGVEAYDAARVRETHWRPLLAELEEQLGRDRAARAVCRGLHRFGSLGVTTADGTTAVPCQVAACAAQRRLVAGEWIELERGMPLALDGVQLDIEEPAPGGVAKTVVNEIRGTYGLHEIEFRPGDVVVDIGAHVGVVSIWLAKRFPFVKVLAYEPWPENYRLLKRNIEANGVGEQIDAFELGVTGDGRELTLSKAGISGDVSAFADRPLAIGEDGEIAAVHSLTLSQIFNRHFLERVRLLKIDCEGAEYEILGGAGELLKRIDYLRGELHTSEQLEMAGHNPGTLGPKMQPYLQAGDDRMKFHVCEI